MALFNAKDKHVMTYLLAKQTLNIIYEEWKPEQFYETDYYRWYSTSHR